MMMSQNKMDQIHIKDLLLRTIIGINAEERTKRQDVLINITLYANLKPAGRTDAIEDAVNYRTITKRIITMVEASSFYLVERLAAETAAICMADLRVAAVQVRIEKPGALRYAQSVGVEIFRSRESLEAEPNRAMIAIGSNIEPEKNLRHGIELLAAMCDIDTVSPVYLASPVGTVAQPAFLNAAIIINTPLSAAALKYDILLPIEDKLKRVRVEDKNAPRTLDLDIVLFNYAVMDVDGRHIPDPDLLKHAHIAVPLADVAPYYVHPETGQSLKEIAVALPMTGIRLYDDLTLEEVIP
jgi:dihydroneopterin aldolase/2-amino-4-hydroxy-6-hydroxymethyldihydropteridine diphosphokinase